MNIQQIENFNEILSTIQISKQKAFESINATLVELYWDIGKYISNEVKQKRWGRSTVKNLSLFIKEKEPNIKGFSDRNIWSMKQFYEAYRKNKKLPSVVAVLSWTHNRRIISLKTLEEREFYLKLCSKKNYSVRELERLIRSGTYERVRDENTKDSDVDILYHLNDVFYKKYSGFIGFKKLNEIKEHISKSIGKKIDLAPKTNFSKTASKYILDEVIYV